MMHDGKGEKTWKKRGTEEEQEEKILRTHVGIKWRRVYGYTHVESPRSSWGRTSGRRGSVVGCPRQQGQATATTKQQHSLVALNPKLGKSGHSCVTVSPASAARQHFQLSKIMGQLFWLVLEVESSSLSEEEDSDIIVRFSLFRHSYTPYLEVSSNTISARTRTTKDKDNNARIEPSFSGHSSHASQTSLLGPCHPPPPLPSSLCCTPSSSSHPFYDLTTFKLPGS